MDFETTMEDNDTGDLEEEGEECVDDPTEPQEPKICCRCGQNFPVEHEMFDSDNCPHFTCADCRFITTSCNLCELPSETLSSSAQAETSNKSLKDLHSMFIKRRIFNKDHIVDVELSSEEGSVQKQMCTICKRVFKKSNARYHYMCATGEKPHACVECGQKFVKKSHLQSHLNSHYGIRPFKCPEPKCKATFTQKDKLTRHMKSHKKETSFTCPLCDKLYSSQDILNHHMIKVHSSTKQFRCDQCPRKYKYPSSLRIHQLKHQAKRDYMCEVCGKKYALSAQLKLHKRSHVTYQRRPFKCNCGRRFISRRDKARHVLIHTSCNDFECSLCKTTFGRKDNLERHMKNFHQDGPPFNIRPAITNKEGSSHMNKKAKSNNVKKEKVSRKDKLKAKPKTTCTRKRNISKGDLNKVGSSVCKEKSNLNVIKFPSNVPESLTAHKEECRQKQSVIVSPQQSLPQNRPSVIKSIPHLLPYRILPIDNKNNHSQMQAPAEKKRTHFHYKTKTQINVVSDNKNSEKATDVTMRVIENTATSKIRRTRISKDDSLNRCYRIIHHTDTVKVDEEYGRNISAVNTKSLNGSLRAAGKSFNEKVITHRYKRQQTRFSSTVVSTLPVHTNSKLGQEVRQNSFVVSSIKTVPVESNNTTNTNIGGPSLLASFTDSVSEVNQEDNFTSSYAPMTEATYSSSSYTPYFDSDYFRDSMNNYEPNVENLLPNDLDIGFQYINEDLGYSETTLSSESRIIRYVSQETRVIRDS